MHQSSSPLQIPYVQFLVHLEHVGMSPEESDVVLAPFSYREVNTLRGGQFDNPEDWANAIRDAQEREQEHYARLTEMGFPDTSGMTARDGHMARIVHLMTKYPKADWDLLLTGQEEAMERKGSLGPRPSPPITLQYIEKQKERFLARQDQRDELVADGDQDGLLSAVIRSWMRLRDFLERHGVDTQDLKNTAQQSLHRDVPKAVAGKSLETVSIHSTYVDPSAQPDHQDRAEVGTAGAEEPAPDTMTAREVSTRVGLTYQTVIRCLASGSIPFGKKVGRNWIVARQPFLDWLASNGDSVRSMSAQVGEKPGRKPKVPQTPASLPASTQGRMPSF